MASLEKLSQDILNLIDESVARFNGTLPALQDKIFADLQRLVKDMELRGNRLANTAANIRAIGTLKSRIERIILNPDYLGRVGDFAKSFVAVSRLQNEYFSKLSNQFGTNDLLSAIRDQSINLTVTNLTESGITSDLTEAIQDLLQRNITGGGKYSDLLDQLRNFITTNETGIGALERYGRQITTDSLNQFSAQYTQAVTEDLGLDWFMYVGSNIETTREFCLLLTKKKYIHRSELPDIVRGIIDGKQIAINPKTKVWSGGIAGTTVSNFQVNRGGYGCGHQLLPIAAQLVPEYIRMRIAA